MLREFGLGQCLRWTCAQEWYVLNVKRVKLPSAMERNAKLPTSKAFDHSFS